MNNLDLGILLTNICPEHITVALFYLVYLFVLLVVGDFHFAVFRIEDDCHELAFFARVKCVFVACVQVPFAGDEANLRENKYILAE